MRLLILFIFYVFLITVIAACGNVHDAEVPQEPNLMEEASEYPTVTPFGVVTYYEIGTIKVGCHDSDSED